MSAVTPLNYGHWLRFFFKIRFVKLGKKYTPCAHATPQEMQVA